MLRISEYIGAIVIVLTAIWHWILRPGHDALNFYNNIQQRFADIEKELKTNGGGSIKDATIRLGEQQLEIVNAIKEIKDKNDRDIERLIEYMAETREDMNTAINDTNHRLDVVMMMMASRTVIDKEIK